MRARASQNPKIRKPTAYGFLGVLGARCSHQKWTTPRKNGDDAVWFGVLRAVLVVGYPDGWRAQGRTSSSTGRPSRGGASCMSRSAPMSTCAHSPPRSPGSESGPIRRSARFLTAYNPALTSPHAPTNRLEHPNPNPNPDPNPNPSTNPNPNPNPNPYPNLSPNHDPNPKPRPNPYSYPSPDPNPNPSPSPKPNPPLPGGGLAVPCARPPGRRVPQTVQSGGGRALQRHLSHPRGGAGARTGHFWELSAGERAARTAAPGTLRSAVTTPNRPNRRCNT
eukprot:336711-Pyramimonas_sp.AAC.2